MGTTELLQRNDPFSKSKRFRSELLGDPSKLFRLESGAVKRAYNGNLATGATTLYTCPKWKRAISPGGLYFVHNPTAGAIALDFHHVPNGGSVANSNKMATLSVAANESRHILSWYTRHVLMAGDSLVINPGSIGLNAWGIFQEIKEDAATFIGGAINDHAGGSTNVTALTCPALRTLVVMSIVGHNWNAGSAVVYAHARESGVAAADSNEIYTNQAVGTGVEFEAWPAIGEIAPQIAIGQGGVISCNSSVSDVNFWVNAILL